MSIDREPRPLGGEWPETLGFPALDITDWSQEGVEIEYDHLMDRALDELDRVKDFFFEGLATFTVLTSGHVERTAVIKDLEFAGPRTITVIHNRPTPDTTGKRAMGTFMWVFDANKETVEYRHGQAYAMDTGWERSSEAPVLVHLDDILAILVKDPELTTPHESMPMDDLETPAPKTQSQVDALRDLVHALQACDMISHNETITDYQYR